MKRFFYSNPIHGFLQSTKNEIIGELVINSGFADELTQKEAWQQQINILKDVLTPYEGSIFFEYSIPRMGRRIDVVLIIKNVIFILEFKVGEKKFHQSDIDQVYDYALDLKNFHETSHIHLIAPVLIATETKALVTTLSTTHHNDNLLFPIKTNTKLLDDAITKVLEFADGESIVTDNWADGSYSPTPTIIEAAKSLFNNHSVTNIARSDATAKNLSLTSKAISDIIENSEKNQQKAICFVTGVPGAGKTLVGLDIATKHLDDKKGVASVYLSGNGPLVAILREALARDRVSKEKKLGNKLKKGVVLREVKAFIQNVHHYRDEYLYDARPPFDHVAIFDEAQRAWNLTQTANFMKRRKNVPNFKHSEPEFLISCLDRHKDWGVVVCLVGGGQEINIGEAGISEWIEAIINFFPKWYVYVSDRLTDNEYAAGKALDLLNNHKNVIFSKDLHLSVSLRSFRAENLSHLVKNLLDLEIVDAQNNYELLKKKYPIVITRDLSKAKEWLKKQARGTERYGIVVSSQAERLKPHCIDVKSPMNPIHWFLNDKEDVRSSYYLEAVATEFHIQGLELDWTCVTWDADFRHSLEGWKYFSFVGSKWNNIRKEERKQYLKNAYRVLLTRARQGMVIVVPNGDSKDQTRNPDYYDATFNYLKKIGFEVL